MTHWLVETDAFDENSSDNIVAALKDAGIPLKRFSLEDYYEKRYNHFPKGESVYFYGSVQVAKEISERALWSPGVIGDFRHYKCSRFYPEYGDLMLSAEHVFMPFGELERQWNFLCRLFENDCLFLRPDGADKGFAGQVVTDFQRFFEKEYPYLSEFNDISTMCLVSSAFNIGAEYRLVISDGKFVTGSRYRLNNSVSRSPEVPLNVQEFGEKLAAIYQPDPIFIVDVCTSNDNLYCLEINPISSAGLYLIDPAKYVAAINESIARHFPRLAV